MDEIQQPIILPNPTSSLPEEKDTTAPYVVEGVIVGVLIALTLIGGMMYKSYLSASIDSQSKKKIQTEAEKARKQELEQVLLQPTTIPTSPTPSPIVLQTKEDLANQQVLLDAIDMTDITKGLDENSSDSAQFEL